MLRRIMLFVAILVVAGMTLLVSGCGHKSPLDPAATQQLPSMAWYEAHPDEVGFVTLDQMVAIIERAYVANPDSSIDEVRAFIWTELKKAKQLSTPPGKTSINSYSIFSLNWQETLLLMGEPWNAFPTNTCRSLAVDETNRQWPGYAQFQDRADGFRHAYWNILMCRRISEDWARKFSTAHEYGAVNGLLDAQMDLNNNGIGRALWRSYSWSRSESQYSGIVKGWQYVKVTSFSGAVTYIIYLAGA